MFDLEIAETYEDDLPLFKELGFKPFETDNKEFIYVGNYKPPNSDDITIDVGVECWPSQFWKIEIRNVEGVCFKIETGSGTLTEYWPSILMVANGIFNVEKM